MKLVNSTPNGQLFMCPYQNKLFLEFGTLFMQLTYDELGQFSEYVNSTDYKFWLAKNQNTQNRRKLLLHLKFNNIYLALHLTEFLELKDLLSLKRNPNALLNNPIVSNNINLN
ncbi:MAG: hypothetical protein JXQ69_06975 [Paludibacteraceae bacterium]|nr:hypothetical protein [Paludibacteraceae bacterium]